MHRDSTTSLRALCCRLRESAGLDHGDVDELSFEELVVEVGRLEALLRSADGFVEVSGLSFEEHSTPTEAPRDQVFPRRPVFAAAAIGMVVATLFFFFEPRPNQPNQANEQLNKDVRAEVMAVVDERVGAINAHHGDRCTVYFQFMQEGECRVEITCPGVEVRSSVPSCAPGEKWGFRWPHVELRGGRIGFDDFDSQGHWRGRAIAHLDLWRTGE